MTAFELHAKKNLLDVTTRGAITSGSVNVYPVKFTFSPDWDGLDKRCVFRAGYGGAVMAVEPDEDGVCNIPWEVLTAADQTLYAGVYGTRGAEIVLPTVWTALGKIFQGVCPGEGSGPPTPDAWQQLKDDLKTASSELENIQQYTQTAVDSAEKAGNYAEAAERSAQESADGAAQAGIQAGLAGDSAGSAAQSAASAEASLEAAQRARTGAESARDEAEVHRDAAGQSAEEAAESAGTAKQYSGKPAIIRDGTWWTWDAEKQDYVDSGDPARGEIGPAGASAYEQAKEAGLSATETEFKTALARAVTAFGDWSAGLTEEEMSDPDIVYERTRPVDWMQMPALEDVQDGELWLLYQWYTFDDKIEDTFTLRSDSDIKVEAGRYEGGVFTPLQQYTQDYHPSSATANTSVSISLETADFGDETSEGKVQAVVRISGDLSYIRFQNGLIREFVLSAKNITEFVMLDNRVLSYAAIANIGILTNFSVAGANSLLAVRGPATPYNNMTTSSDRPLFASCYSLLAIPNDITFASLKYINTAYGFGSFFSEDYSLRKLPVGISPDITGDSGKSFCRGCYSLTELPPNLTFKGCTDVSRVFDGCRALHKLPQQITYLPQVTTATNAFSNSGLREILNLYIPLCSNINNAFSGCTCLERLTFDPRMTTWETPQDINLANTALSHGAIVELFESLPTIETVKTVTITGTPGASQVTAEDVAIATAKGWKVAGAPAGIATASTGVTDGPEIFDGTEDMGEPYFVDRYGNEYYGPFYKA